MPDFSKLYNLYWFIRYHRKKNIKRRYYRYIAAEKKRLLDAGVDNEEIRLLCRHPSNLRNKRAENRLEAYRKTLEVSRASEVIATTNLT